MPSISQALDELLNERETPVGDVMSRYFADDYRQSTNGDWADRAAFAQQIEFLRAGVDVAEIEVLAELVGGGSYAERHVIHVTQTDGTVVAQEAYVFAEVAEDGRFASLTELTRPVTED